MGTEDDSQVRINGEVIMAHPKANEPRVVMKVPVSFRDMVLKESKQLNVLPTDYLEGKKVVPA